MKEKREKVFANQCKTCAYHTCDSRIKQGYCPLYKATGRCCPCDNVPNIDEKTCLYYAKTSKNPIVKY